MTHAFSQEKFLTLSLQRRHKYAADLLKMWYESLEDKNSSYAQDHYERLAAYLKLPKILQPSKETLSQRYHHHLHCAGLSVKEHHLLPTIQRHDSCSTSPFLPIDIYLDHIRSAHNVGSILRTTEALRLGQIFIPPTMANLSSKKMQDTAMGTKDLVQCHITEDLSMLKKPLIAIETCPHSTSLYSYTFPKSFSLLFGNEEYGLSHEILQKADRIVHVPMHGYKNSLNVACCFALVAGEIRRQLAIFTSF